MPGQSTEESEVVMFTVHFNGNGGTPTVESMDVQEGRTLSELPIATRDGYSLEGWYTEPDGGIRVSTFTPIDSEATFHAHWIPTPYEITYNLHGRGSMPDSAKTSYTIEDPTYQPPAPSRNIYGFTFSGWIPENLPTGTFGDFEFRADWVSEKPRVAMCSIAKGGSQTIQDWISHHLEIGFDRIYIYNDGTLDGFKQMLLDYPSTYNADKVTVIDFPHNPEKDYTVAAYAHFFRTYRSEYEWMAFIDPDDYVMLVDRESIKEVLNSVEIGQYEAVRLNVVEFSDYLQFTRDFDFQGEGFISLENTSTTKKMAKTILNCKAKGLLMGKYTPTRNGQELKQCLPNLEPVHDRGYNMTKKGTDVNKVDTSIMYVTPNQMEIRWRKWKRERGY